MVIVEAGLRRASNERCTESPNSECTRARVVNNSALMQIRSDLFSYQRRRS